MVAARTQDAGQHGHYGKERARASGVPTRTAVLALPTDVIRTIRGGPIGIEMAVRVSIRATVYTVLLGVLENRPRGRRHPCRAPDDIYTWTDRFASVASARPGDAAVAGAPSSEIRQTRACAQQTGGGRALPLAHRGVLRAEMRVLRPEGAAAAHARQNQHRLICRSSRQTPNHGRACMHARSTPATVWLAGSALAMRPHVSSIYLSTRHMCVCMCVEHVCMYSAAALLSRASADHGGRLRPWSGGGRDGSYCRPPLSRSLRPHPRPRLRWCAWTGGRTAGWLRSPRTAGRHSIAVLACTATLPCPAPAATLRQRAAGSVVVWLRRSGRCRLTLSAMPPPVPLPRPTTSTRDWVDRCPPAPCPRPSPRTTRGSTWGRWRSGWGLAPDRQWPRPFWTCGVAEALRGNSADHASAGTIPRSRQGGPQITRGHSLARGHVRSASRLRAPGGGGLPGCGGASGSMHGAECTDRPMRRARAPDGATRAMQRVCVRVRMAESGRASIAFQAPHRQPRAAPVGRLPGRTSTEREDAAADGSPSSAPMPQLPWNLA